MVASGAGAVRLGQRPRCWRSSRDVQLLGLERCVDIAEEIRDPQRLLPRALALGTGAVVALYLALNLLYVYSLPAAELAALSGSVLDVIGARLFGPRAGDLLAALTAVSIAASVSAMTIAGPRVYFAMARDGAFFRRAAVIHPRFRTPSAAIGAQAFWASAVLTGGFDQLIHTTASPWCSSGGGRRALRAATPRRLCPVDAWGYRASAGALRRRQRAHRRERHRARQDRRRPASPIIAAGLPLDVHAALGPQRTTEGGNFLMLRGLARL